jgi:hypothetical protein
MKSRLLSFAAIVALVLVGTASLHAQGSIAPSSQLGIGVNTSGITLQYAISPSVQVGALATLLGVSSDGNSATYFGLAPYVRFLLEGTVNPIFDVGAEFTKDPGLAIGDTNNTSTALFASFGLEYFINRNVGVFATAQLLYFQLDPSPTVVNFGYFRPRAGIEWYFNP